MQEDQLRARSKVASIRHERFAAVGSTNAEALARARAGERGPLWISAEQQTAGRGRRGKTWSSPPGNLYATLLLAQPCTLALAPQLSFVAGLAVHDAVAETGPELAIRLKLKWPNDLLLADKKLAGVLIESECRPFAVAIGFGINCATHPADVTYLATDLRSSGCTIAPLDLLWSLADAMNRRLDQWREGHAFAAIRADWLACAAGLGAPIKVRLPERQLDGVFKGIDERGQLILATGTSTQTIAAGDVFALGGG
jgi:BirA family transcriptional regulator, biotin operon repressor / biotin---[acetyl-CoA-carboxylase] ligase